MAALLQLFSRASGGFLLRRAAAAASAAATTPARGSGVVLPRSLALPPFRVRRYASSAVDSMRKLRNIGIIAHVDAGKTTTCERMILYSGLVRVAGDVDKGDTVMDYMALERERGITINSAAITLPWTRSSPSAVALSNEQHQINVVDTPGHVDFTVEVERAVRVMDGAVVILDAVSGVQPQTETVWRQANRYDIPCVAFINKMDREGASLDATLQSMSSKLYITDHSLESSINNAKPVRPLLLQLPLNGAKNAFVGTVDLVTMEAIEWDPQSSNGKVFTRTPLVPESNKELFDRALSARAKLIETLAEIDDDFVERYLELSERVQENELVDRVWGIESVTSAQLIEVIRRVAHKRLGLPVLLGSSLKNKGVQPLMDAIIDYLPSPIERALPIAVLPTGERVLVSPLPPSPEATELVRRLGTVRNGKSLRVIHPELCALAFKVVHDHNRGLIVYVRVYSGALEPSQKIVNLNTKDEERIGKLFRIIANDLEPITELGAGDIAAVVGLKKARTGDTLSLLPKGKKTAESDAKLEGLSVPRAVFMCSVEAMSTKHQQQLDTALSLLQMEDPSFHITTPQDTGQTLMNGMGELHIQILFDRLLNHYKVECQLGKMHISYRACLPVGFQAQQAFEYTLEWGGKQTAITLTLSLLGKERGSGSAYVDAIPKTCAIATHLVRAALAEGVAGAFASGAVLGFPLEDLQVTITDLVAEQSEVPTMFYSAASKAVLSLVPKQQVKLLEPIMQLEVAVSEQHLGNVLADLTGHRRGMVGGVDLDLSGRRRLVHAHVPLKELVGYSTYLRSVSQGTADFYMNFAQYGELSAAEQQAVFEQFFYRIE